MKVNALSLELKVDQSAVDNAPLTVAEAVGRLNVCTVPDDDMPKSVPVAPVANVCVIHVNPLSDVMPTSDRVVFNRCPFSAS